MRALALAVIAALLVGHDARSDDTDLLPLPSLSPYPYEDRVLAEGKDAAALYDKAGAALVRLEKGFGVDISELTKGYGEWPDGPEARRTLIAKFREVNAVPVAAARRAAAARYAYWGDPLMRLPSDDADERMRAIGLCLTRHAALAQADRDYDLALQLLADAVRVEAHWSRNVSRPFVAYAFDWRFESCFRFSLHRSTETARRAMADALRFAIDSEPDYRLFIHLENRYALKRCAETASSDSLPARISALEAGFRIHRQRLLELEHRLASREQAVLDSFAPAFEAERAGLADLSALEGRYYFVGDPEAKKAFLAKMAEDPDRAARMYAFRLFHPSLIVRDFKRQAGALRVLLIACELQRYIDENGAPPATLDLLGLPESVLHDPWSTGRFRYAPHVAEGRLRAAGAWIYRINDSLDGPPREEIGLGPIEPRGR